MDRAINKSTNKLIDAFEVYKNGSYQNLTKGEWIAPKDSIHNWEEITEEDSFVHYVKEKKYTNWRGTNIATSPHFAIYPNSKAKTVLESPEHKMLKDWLFNRLKEDDLKIIYSRPTKKYKYDNSNKLSELEIDWNNYSIEVPIRSIKSLKADILLPFKRNHPILGFGIIIEIQLSNQNIEITYDRSFDRAICGYSTIWLFKKDFETSDDKKEIELKNNKLIVFSFSSELKILGGKFMKNLKISVQEQCRFLDDKQQELNTKAKEVENYKEEFIDNTKKRINDFFSYKIKELSENFNEEITNKVQDNFFHKNEKEIEKILENLVKKIIEDKLIIEVTNEINLKDIKNEARIIIHDKLKKNYNAYKELISNPPKCNGCNSSLILDHGIYGVWLRCPNYPECQVKSKHAIPKEIEELFYKNEMQN